MWKIFKLTNFICILVSSYVWVTSVIPMAPMMIVLSVIMFVCLSFLPMQFKFDVRTGVSLLIYVLLVLWTIFNRSAGMGAVVASLYFPVFFLTQLPRGYQSDLLYFVTKWLAILLIPALIIYWITLFVDLPAFGVFVHPDYEPFTNYIFFIKTTFDYGIFERFNAFFLEPGQLSMVCLFLVVANGFNLKNRWIWVLLTAIAFSFSLAGYLLTLMAFGLMKVNSVRKGLAFLAAIVIAVVAIQNIAGGDNALNELILERLERDESKGIKGNNRYYDNTDYAFEKAMSKGYYWTGVNDKANMELIGGAGLKIYILRYGLVGMLLVLAFYLSLIPSHPNWPYTLKFLFLIVVCFVQNAYPEWYSWLFPYVIGLSVNRKADDSDGEFLPIIN